MTKYTKSREALPTNLHLWDPQPTQTAITETRVMDFFPTTSIGSSDTITFTVPAMQKYMLDRIEIVTELRVQSNTNQDPVADINVSTSPYLAASLWRNVYVTIANTSITQSFDNSYNLFKFWDTIIHHPKGCQAILNSREGLNLDGVQNKEESENLVYFPVADGDNPIPPVVNQQGKERAVRIQEGRKVCLISDFNIPLFKQSKLLPPNMEINIQLTKNYSEFILLSAVNRTEQVVFDHVSLRCTFQKPAEVVLNLIEERLARDNAIYHADKNMMTFHSLSEGAEEVTIDNIFTGTLPYFFIFGVQDRAAFGRARNKNAFSLYKMKTVNIHVNGQPLFVSPITCTPYDSTYMYSMFMNQCGMMNQGNSLLNNMYNVYPAMSCDLTQDKSQNQHNTNLSRVGSVRITIGFEEPLPANRILMVLAYYEQIIEISKDRTITFI